MEILEVMGGCLLRFDLLRTGWLLLVWASLSGRSEMGMGAGGSEGGYGDGGGEAVVLELGEGG